MTDNKEPKMPDEIMVWRSSPNLSHVGTWATTRYPEEAVPYVPKADVGPDSSTIKSVLGYTYDLKAALKRNPTIIQAGDDICAVALRRIEELESAVTSLRAQLEKGGDE